MSNRASRKLSREERADGGGSSESDFLSKEKRKRRGDGDRHDAGQLASADVQRAKGSATGASETSNADADYVSYDPGPDREELSTRYGLRVGAGEAQRLQRLESEHGSTQVRRWADEGLPVDVMGRPQDMRAFRERRRGGPGRPDSGSGTDQTDGGQTGSTQAPDAVRSVVSSAGQSIEEPVQREMESKMGGEFSDVEVHTGPDAAAAAESIDARAFTVGSDVAFNAGEYQPDTEKGKRVLAHELTHVRQQTDGRVRMLPEADSSQPAAEMQSGVATDVQPKLEVSSPEDPAEKEAERVAERVASADAAPAHAAADESTAVAGTRQTRDQDAGVSTRRVDERVQRGLFGDVADAAESAAESAGEAVESAAEGAADAAESAAESAKEAGKSAAESATEAGESVVESAGQAVDAISEGVSDLGEQAWRTLEAGGKQVWEALERRGDAVAEMVRQGGQRAWRILQQGGEQVWNVLQNAGGTAWSVLKNGGQQLWTLLERNQQFLVTMLRNGGQRVLDVLKAGGRQVWQVLQNAGGQVWSALRSMGQRLWALLRHNQPLLVGMIGSGGAAWQILREGGQRLWNVLQQSGGRVWTALSNAGDRLWTLLETNTTILVNIIESTGGRAWQILTAGANRLWPILQQAGSRVWNTLVHTGGRLRDLIASDDQFLVNVVQNGGSRVFGILANSGNRLWNVFRRVGPRVWDVLEQTGQRLWDLLGQSTALLVNVLRNGSQRAWRVLGQSGEQLWTILQNSGQRARSALLSSGRRLWDLLERTAPLFTRILREGWQQFWALVERSRQRFFTLLNNVVSSDVVQALLRGGQQFVSFVTQTLSRVATFLETAGEYAGRVILTSLQQFAYFVVQTPRRVVRLVTEFSEGNVQAFGQWLWAGLQQLVSDPSGMEEWLASGAEGEGRPARMLTSIVDVLPAAELWAYWTTLFRGGRQPENVSELRTVIGDAVTYENVRIVENSELSGRAFVTGHVIDLPSSDSNPSPGNGDFRTLVHEFVHVGQYEAVGTRYIPEAIHAQNSDMGYDYRLEDLENESFSSFSREQQASILGDYYGHVLYSVSEPADLVVDGKISRSGTAVASVEEYFNKYDSLYSDTGPFERHRDEFQSGRV